MIIEYDKKYDKDIKSLLEKGESVAQAIDRLFFSSSVNLQSEYKRLFASLFNKPEPYLDIIRILSNSRQGISRDEIIKLLGKSNNGHISEYLQNLINCDFVRYYFVKTKKTSKTNGLYQLTDFFTIFQVLL